MRANLYTHAWTDSAVRRFIREIGSRLEKVLILSRCDITSYRKEKVKEKLKLLNELGERIKALNSAKELKCPVSGNDIMKKFNLPPGPVIGKIKTSIMNGIIEGGLPESGDAEIYFAFASKLLKNTKK